MRGPSGALVQVTEHLSGLPEPAACGGDLRGISTMLVVAVLWSYRGATAVCTTVHSTPSPPSDRHRLEWRARAGLGPTLTGLAIARIGHGYWRHRHRRCCWSLRCEQSYFPHSLQQTPFRRFWRPRQRRALDPVMCAQILLVRPRPGSGRPWALGAHMGLLAGSIRFNFEPLHVHGAAGQPRSRRRSLDSA